MTSPNCGKPVVTNTHFPLKQFCVANCIVNSDFLNYFLDLEKEIQQKSPIRPA